MARTSRLDEIIESHIHRDLHSERYLRPQDEFAVAKEQIKLLFLEVIGEDEPGKLLLDIGSEFATPRDYKRCARNHFREHLRQLVEAL